MKQTQYQQIMRHVDTFGSISPIEAFYDYGITKLSTRISELRRRGVEFEKHYVKSKNRFGEPVYYMRYSLRD